MNIRIAILLLFIIPTGLYASPAKIEAEVRSIEAARVEALVAGNLTTLRGLFHPECVYTHGSGKVQNGEDYLQLLERGDLRYLAMDYEFPPMVRFAGDNTAVVSGRVRLTAQGRGGPPNNRIMAATAVYSLQDSSWVLVSFQNTPAPAPPSFTVLSSHLAVKDVCAWPKLTRLENGTIFAAFYDQASHGQTPGDVACWASTDGGITWEFRGKATRHDGNQAWFNHAMGLAANGDLLIATSGWDYESPDGGKVQTPLVPQVVRSSDGGRTWRKSGRFPTAPEPLKAFIPFGNIERGEDGVLRVAAFSYARSLPEPRTDTGYVIVSKDDGETWEIGGIIGEPEVNETDILHTSDGRWLAAARNLTEHSARKAHSLDLYISDDHARTWRRHTRLTEPDQHPGDLLELADGRILLTYGDRRGPDYGVNARISEDGGLKWSPEFRLVGGLHSRDSGYPSSVQLDDGTIVTAYYSKGSPSYAGYQMGTVRWRLD